MRVLQVGLGGWGRSWAAVVGDAQGIELAGVVDGDPEARRWADENLGLPADHCNGSLKEGLASTACEAVLVITPPGTHHAVVAEALDAGKHVLVEKPLATTMPEALSLVSQAAERGLILSVSQNYRFTRPARAARQLILDGALGDITSVKVACRRDTRRVFPPGDFRYAMRHPYVRDMAIHHFDLLRALTGENVTEIYARSWPVPDSPYEHDPAVTALIALEGGATVTYEGDWATYGRETTWNGDWEIVGRDGRLLWSRGKEDGDAEGVTLKLWDEPPRTAELPQLPATERAAILQQLGRAVEEGGRQPETNARDNVNSLAVMLGCVESIESRAPADTSGPWPHLDH